MEVLFNVKSDVNADAKGQLKEFSLRKNSLLKMDVDQIVKVFDEISKYLSSKNCKIKQLLINNELGFIIFWLKKSNIKKILELNFEDYKYLDSPKFNEKNNSLVLAKPLGIAVHWIAGNVPVLGVISLFQTLLTKNKSIVKVPATFKTILSEILEDLMRSQYFDNQIKDDLYQILESIFIIYIDRNDSDSQEEISKISDIRIAWGGLEAVESISKLPKKLNTRDIIFGPKLSLSFIAKDSIKDESDLIKLSQGITDDVFAFNQAGCNAPHNIVIEDGFKFKISDFMQILTTQFENRAKKSYISSDPMLTFNLLVKKFLFQSDLKKDVYQGADNQWNIFVNHSKNIHSLEVPVFSRNIFVSTVSSVEELGKLLPENVQSVGLRVKHNQKIEIIDILSNYGVDRFPDIGKMSIYNHPWDGYLPLQQTVKWISTN
tara:strand:- start:16084 stop:17379 length:1296 start_codon:yes stop_codon:yes gene_type:complete